MEFIYYCVLKGMKEYATFIMQIYESTIPVTFKPVVQFS